MPKPPSKTPPPLSSFGPELLATLREGANREVRITFDDPRIAVRFEQRIHQLRRAMKLASAPGWEQLYRCGVRTDLDNPRILILAPKDSEFRRFLQDAQIPVDSPPDVTEVAIATPSPGNDADDFLSTLVDVTRVPPDLDKKSGEG